MIPELGLGGNVKDSRWTIGAFPKSIATTDGVYAITVRGIGGGHDVIADFKVIIPKITATVNKTWIGGLKAPIEVQLNRKTVDSNFEKVIQAGIINPVTLTANASGLASYTWTDLYRTDGIGRLFEYDIAEISGANGYSSSLTSSYSASDLVYTFNLVNTYTRVMSDLVVEKKWVGGISVPVTISVYRQLEGSEARVLFAEVTLDGQVESDAHGSGELEPWKYTFKNIDLTTDDGLAYTYTIDEEDVPLNFIKSVDNETFTITNSYVTPRTSITANKVWINGPSDHPDIQLQLYQNDIPYGTPITLVSPETTYTWDDLPLTDINGIAYVYTVDELTVLDNYTKTLSSDKLTITNTYVSPKTEITISKVWVGGAEVKPTIELQLYRNNEKYMDPFILVDGELTRTFTDLEKTDINGNEYTYRVDELNVPENYRKEISEDGLTVTNTYHSPLTSVNVNKIWVGGPDVRPDIYLQLYRDNVKEGSPIKLENGDTTYTFMNLLKTDENAREYTYRVDEVEVPINYEKMISEDGLTITNTYKSPLISITGNKVWVNGPDLKPSISLQLYRDNTPYLNPVSLINGSTSFTWENLEKTDEKGNEYTYRVDELAIPENYSKENSLDGLTVTNTYHSPTIEITGTKSWIDGPNVHPDIQLQLYRNGEALHAPVLLVDGQTEYTWQNLAKTDQFGNEYRYTVDEVNTPENYVKENTDNGYKVVNTYKSPLTEIVGTKVWVNGPSDKPVVSLQLYRDGIAYLDSITLSDGATRATWKDLELTDRFGKAYVYTVDELEVPNNYIKTVNEDGTTITNTYKSEKIAVTGTKVWVNGPEIHPTVYLQLFRDGESIGNPILLANGTESYTWSNLDLTDIDGNLYTYRVDELNIPENYIKSISEDGLTITNTYKSPLTEVVGTKVWDGGPEIKPNVSLQLYRDGIAYLDSIILRDGATSATWDNLDLTDINGRNYVYTIDEVTTPEDYVKTISDDGLTVTNRYKSPLVNITGNKVWLGGLELKPDITLQLYKDGIAYLEPVILSDSVTSHTWYSLEERDHHGNAYVYTVDELNVPENYVKKVSEDGLTITNTYKSPLTTVRGTKVWIGGPDNHPDIQLQLYRNGEAIHTPATLSVGQTEFVWRELPLTDNNGLA